MKKGMSMVELLISMAVLATLMLTFTAIYSTGLSRLKDELIQTQLQGEVQVIVDRITNEITQAQGVEQEYQGINLSPSYLPLKIPAIDTDQNILYNGNQIIYDHVIYQINGDTLTRTVVADSNSKRYGENNIPKSLSEDILSMTFAYLPEIASPNQINIDVTLEKKSGNKTKSINLHGSARFRNNL